MLLVHGDRTFAESGGDHLVTARAVRRSRGPGASSGAVVERVQSLPRAWGLSGSGTQLVDLSRG